MCLPSRCLAMNVSSDFVIPPFGRHVTILTLLAVGRDPAGVVCGVSQLLWGVCTGTNLYIFRWLLPVRRRWTISSVFPSQPESKSKSRYDLRSVGQSVLVSSTHLGPKTTFLLMLDIYNFVDLGRPLWREDGYVICWRSQSAVRGRYIYSFTCRHSTQSFVMSPVPWE
jgi:hypothetical protein